MMKLEGAMTALVTPFSNGRIDEDLYATLIRRQIACGIDVVVPAGTTGESATMSHDEHKRCIEIAVEVCKQSGVKVCAGAGSNATHESIDLARFAQKAGADGILVVTPYYNKPTQEGLYQHYKAIASSVEIGVMLYNVPGRTGVDLRPETVARLHDELPNIYGIKEATGSMERTVELLAKRPGLFVVSGDDTINYPILANGGRGFISVTSNLIPQTMSRLAAAAMTGNLREAKEINTALFELNKALFVESNPIPIKAAMYLAGILPTLEYRLPLVPPSKETMALLEQVITNYEIPSQGGCDE